MCSSSCNHHLLWQDGAEPAASSVAVSNLLRLSAFSAPEEAADLRNRAIKTLSAFSERLNGMPVALTQMCCSAYLLEAGEALCNTLRLSMQITCQAVQVLSPWCMNSPVQALRTSCLSVNLCFVYSYISGLIRQASVAKSCS